jgi:hypothetical protein
VLLLLGGAARTWPFVMQLVKLLPQWRHVSVGKAGT